MTRKGMAINVNAVLKNQNPNTTYMIGHKRKGMVTFFVPYLTSNVSRL